MHDKKPTSTCPNPYCEDGRVLSSATGLNNEYMGDCRHPDCPAVEPEHPVREDRDENAPVEASNIPYGKTTPCPTCGRSYDNDPAKDERARIERIIEATGPLPWNRGQLLDLLDAIRGGDDA